ncbi:MAG TPA: hypothetical protein PLZ05_02935 [Alphaproteobacteria bacterium]|nr:hypothetical protein [Alphaproteobacteria bacterium]
MSTTKEYFFEEAIQLFGMRTRGEIKRGELEDPKKREVILKNIRKKRRAENLNKKKAKTLNDNSR